MALNILEESAVILRTRWAFLLPSSARDFILILLQVTKDVSADEKNADKAISITSAIICTIILGSKKSTPFYYFYRGYSNI